MSCLIRSATVVSAIIVLFLSVPRCARLQREGVQLIAHRSAKRLVDQLVLLNPGFAAEGGGDDMGRVMLPVATAILDRDARVREAFLDQPHDRLRVHRHNRVSGRNTLSRPPCKPAATPHWFAATH